jgi:hypothetical protein
LPKIPWDLLLFVPYKNSLEQLTDLYLRKDWSIETIAEKLGVSKSVVWNEIIRLELPRRSKGRPRLRPIFSVTLATYTSLVT